MRQRIILVLFVVISIAVASSVGAQDSLPRLWWSADQTDVKSGQQTTLRIQVSAADQIYGVSFQLNYDPAVFEVVLNNQSPVSAGDFFGGQPGFAVQNGVDVSAGRVDYALTLTQPAQPVSGDGVLATLTLRALKDTPVQVTLVNASLVSPQFEDVNGTLVARSIRQVPAQIIDSAQSVAAVSVPAAPADAAVAAAPAGGELPAAFNHIDLTQTAVQAAAPVAVVAVSSSAISPVSLATLVFFAAGALLLLVSLWMYTRIRHLMPTSSEFEIGV
jgi:hypothetical protein